MSRGASKAAQQQLNLEKQTSAKYGAAGDAVGGQVLPFLTNEMNSPSGFSQQDLSNMMTLSGQTIGGTLGTAKAAAEERAARSGNAAGAGEAEDQATREAMAARGDNTMKIQMANEAEKMAQQQAGASGLERIQGMDVNASLSALGMGNGSIQAWNQADANTLSSIMAPFQAIAGLGSAAGSIMGGLGSMNGPGNTCMIAEAIWGINDSRVHIMRMWLNREFEWQHPLGRGAMSLYRGVGPWVSRQPILVKMLKPVFEIGLVHAYRWFKTSQAQAFRNRWVG